MVMASAGVNMPGGGGGDGNTAGASFSSSSPGCRMRKRRRLAPPPAAGSSGSGGGGADAAGPSRNKHKHKRVRPASPSASASSSSEPSEADSDDGEQGEGGVVDAEDLPPAGPPPPPQRLAAAAARELPVAFGSLSVAGRSRDMEDTVSLRPGFCTWGDGSPMHFFGVFDGHGGSHVAELCRDRMHEFLAEELAVEAASFPQRLRRRQQQQAAAAVEGTTSSAAGGAAALSVLEEKEEEEDEEELAWRAALERAFRRVDAMASLACACGRIASPPCRCPLSGNSGIVGSTAVVALLVRGRVVVANCGDSRAVLCRRGPAGAAPVPLSHDHKPNRPDELARIQAAGGRVVFNNGHRVRGILAMSRALGDRMLRPEVIAEPEITVTDRTPEDECLILASDGMWDAVPNEIACSVAWQCLQDGNAADAPVDDAAAASGEGAAAAAAGPEPAARCSNAASLLVRLAFGRDAGITLASSSSICSGGSKVGSL